MDLRGRDASLTQAIVLTPMQLRAARAFVGWSREELAEKSGVPAITTKQFENGDTDPRLSTLHKWRRALEAAGVIFIDPDEKDGPGVRLKGSRAKR
jgi:transcriptional regulator with XRE-family HTH domain